MSLIHVAVAAIVNDKHEVLIALRPDHVHQGGLWEFPGGKIEVGESVRDALQREISEEIGIDIHDPQPLIQIRHDYSDKSVLLDVWRVDHFEGKPSGREGQAIRWQSIKNLEPEQFPAANRGIIRALSAPDHYVITGDFNDIDDFFLRMSDVLRRGYRLIQLRLKADISPEQSLYMQQQSFKLCDAAGASLLLNTSVECFKPGLAHGLHMNSKELMRFTERPVSSQILLSVSCHSEQEIEQAILLDADVILLSPVKETRSHPGVAGIGWSRFKKLVQKINRPVYALGGMSEFDIKDAKLSGAQGIAAISAFWNHEK